MRQITVRELFEALGSFPEELSYACFSPQKLTPQSPVIVFDSDALADEGEDLPSEAVEGGLTAELGLRDIESIVANAQQQGLEPTLAQFVEGLEYYLANDAYKQWRDWRDDPQYWPKRRPSTEPASDEAVLFAVDGTVNDVMADRIGEAVRSAVESVAWRLSAPRWANTYDESLSVPGHERVRRTVGLWLHWSALSEPRDERLRRADLEALLEIMQHLSRAKGLPLVIVVSGERSGSISRGELDSLARERLRDLLGSEPLVPERATGGTSPAAQSRKPRQAPS